MRSPPHAARRRTRAPTVRALRTAAPRIRRVGHKQSPPPRNQAGQLTARHRQQRPIVGVADQFVEQVEPVPHRLPENLTQNPVHLAPFPVSRISALCDPAHALSTDRVGQRHTSWACTAPIGRAKTDERHTLIGGTDQLGLMRVGRWQQLITHPRAHRAPAGRHLRAHRGWSRSRWMSWWVNPNRVPDHGTVDCHFRERVCRWGDRPVEPPTFYGATPR